MSKKLRRRAPRSKSAPTNLSPEAVERKAREDLASGRHREAIAGFKQLLKLEPRQVWRTALADAYAGRARELAAKGMVKEALVMWENRAGLGEGIAFEPEQAALLLRMGRVEPVLALFADTGAVPSAERDRLRPLLAARYLAGEDTIAERLPADDPVVLHAEAARAALAAYCAGDKTALQATLTEIPFRSPYRDWVQILKALQRLPESPEEAAGQLARVAEGSAFGHLRRAAELALLPEAAFLAAIRGAGKTTVRFACALRGWPQARIVLWEELDRLGTAPRPETQLRLMYRHREALGADWIRRRGLRLLIAGYPASLKWRGSMGARPTSREEALLVAAWVAERRGDPWDEHERWESYARYLIHEQTSEGQDSLRNLRIALAFRRCDGVGDVLSSATPSADPEDLDRLVAAQLEESLTWDPDDCDTYLGLIHYYRRGKLLKDVRRLLEQAAARWPKDMQVLGAALDTALDAGSFKKAAGLAREMLALDPINSGVRERLVEAHLAHARKQINKGRPDLARKELVQAGEWARSGHARDQLDLTSGLIALFEDAETGAPALRDMVGRLGGGLAGLLAFALAGEALKLSPQKLFKTIGLDKPSAAGRDDLLATLSRLRTHLDSGGKITRELGTSLDKALATAPWTGLSRGETEGACDTLRRCGLHKVRLRVARIALKRWKGEPVFELHAFDAKYPKGFNGRSDNDIYRLEIALERAREEGDTRTALRIEEILASLSPFGIGPMPFAPPPRSDSTAFSPDAEVIVTLFETLGLDQALNMLGVPPDMKRDLKGLARRNGKKAAAETLISFLEMLGGFAEGGLEPPVPRPPPRRPAGPEGGKPKRGSDKDIDRDDEFPDQLDLF
ncbi:MAG: hypothetical protein U9Q81_02345 [Pseudomonadota bacterium]|nr:hypothetical protein [Pseudomonadota bacterium]